MRPIVYADWTASGRSLGVIERKLSQDVIPFYGNTHTTTSITGLQSTCFRHEARQIIAQSVNANTGGTGGRGAADVVLFTGSGSTGAIVKMVAVLGLHHGNGVRSESAVRRICASGIVAAAAGVAAPSRRVFAQLEDLESNALHGKV